MRVGASLRATLVLGLALHHHFEGPPIDYYGLAAAAAASWVGVPGPGEPVLITAGVLAARHKLDIGSVLLVAWAAAMAGGVAGWVIGMKAGRVVLTTQGPLHRMRVKALERGDEVFARWPVTAVLVTPSWIAGIHRVRPATYLLTNALGAALWAVGIGLGAFIVGPSIVDFVDDLGWVTVAVLVALVVAGLWLEVGRRRWRRARRETTEAAAPSEPQARPGHTVERHNGVSDAELDDGVRQQGDRPR